MFTRLMMAGVATALLTSMPVVARTQASVVRFHGDAAPASQALALKPQDPALAGSLEFSTYANQLGAALERLGFTPASATAPATLIGEISYAQTVVATPPEAKRPRFSIGVGIGGGIGSNVGVNVGTNIPVGGNRDASSKILTLSLVLRQPAVTPGGAPVSVWEGRVTTEALDAKRADLALLMPKLIDALLAEFPGPSGKRSP